MIEIDHRQLSPETLNHALTDIALRGGTEEGQQDVSLETQKARLHAALESGHAMMVFHAAEGYCDIIPTTNER